MYRSHLMQQFAAAARTQSRPPLALAASVTSSSRETNRKSSSSSSLQQQGSLRSYGVNSYTTTSAVHESAAAASNDFQESDTTNDNTTVVVPSPLLASSMQTLIKTRRTATRFTLDATTDTTKLREALDRAILCAQAAPNHKRTEPFCFKRMLAPSPRTLELSEIAAQVVYRKKMSTDPTNAQAHANRKRTKWNQIPAYLVTLVDHQPPQQQQPISQDDPYQVLPYVAPETERQLEDYASACAAVQNVLLSLHAEGIATKWATGPVISTPAFRSLVRAQETQRVVALIMVGQNHDDDAATTSSSATIKPRRYRRTELVKDL